MYRIALAVIITTFLVSCSTRSDCYLDGKVCAKGVYYESRPETELFFIPNQKPNTFNPIVPQDGSKGFLIKAVEKKGVLYIAYQVYKGESTCEAKPYIYTVQADFEIRIYAFKLNSDEKYSLVPISSEQEKYLEEWISHLKIDERKGFSCMEGGEVEYADWRLMS